MGQIQINYEEVYRRTAQLRNRINYDLLSRIENEYRNLDSVIDELDGATAAALKKTMEENRQKSIAAAAVLDKLLSFMANSSQQVELNEQIMANTILSGTNVPSGGAG